MYNRYKLLTFIEEKKKEDYIYKNITHNKG